MGISIGIDTGGTFVDVAVMDEQGNVSIAKTPTTPREYLAGVMQGLTLAGQGISLSTEELLSRTTKFVYGTTIATNYVLEGKGRGRVGLIVTRGFRDTLYIRRGIRRSVFETQDAFPLPTVRRLHTREINERIDWAGNVLVPLDEEEVRQVARELVNEKPLAAGRIEAIAVCLLHSYANPIHERRVAEILREEFPDLFVTASVEVAPEIREYERMSTVAYSASIGKMFATHLVELEKELSRRVLKVPPQVILSSGGTAGIAEASRRPINCLFSGPAGGVIGAQYLGSLVNAPNVITMDMGGTSFDVGLIRNGLASTVTLSQIGDYPVLGERTEIHSIGAGGGSIASVDEQGILKVGPRSAGADPGPVCYDKGGTEPTVTDADVVLGYINPDYFLGGAVRLNAQKAWKAIKEKVADKQGVSVPQAASGIVRIVNENMLNALRVLSVERGYDPRDFTIMAFGGAGPTHGASLYSGLGAKELLMPFSASAFSAFGMLVTNLKHSYVRSYRSLLADLNLEKANGLMSEMVQHARAALEAEGVPRNEVRFEASIDVSYEGQLHEMNVPISGVVITDAIVEEARESFAKQYEALYGFHENLPVQVLSFRLNGIGEAPLPRLKKYEAGSEEPSKAFKGTRQVYFEEKSGFVPTKVYDGPRLEPGNKLAGPAIVEYPTTTLVVLPSQQCTVDEWLNARLSQR